MYIIWYSHDIIDIAVTVQYIDNIVYMYGFRKGVGTPLPLSLEGGGLR